MIQFVVGDGPVAGCDGAAVDQFTGEVPDVNSCHRQVIEVTVLANVEALVGQIPDVVAVRAGRRVAVAPGHARMGSPVAIQREVTKCESAAGTGRGRLHVDTGAPVHVAVVDGDGIRGGRQGASRVRVRVSERVATECGQICSRAFNRHGSVAIPDQGAHLVRALRRDFVRPGRQVESAAVRLTDVREGMPESRCVVGGAVAGGTVGCRFGIQADAGKPGWPLVQVLTRGRKADAGAQSHTPETDRSTTKP